jgi:hypothetical protein
MYKWHLVSFTFLCVWTFYFHFWTPKHQLRSEESYLPDVTTFFDAGKLSEAFPLFILNEKLHVEVYVGAWIGQDLSIIKAYSFPPFFFFSTSTSLFLRVDSLDKNSRMLLILVPPPPFCSSPLFCLFAWSNEVELFDVTALCLHDTSSNNKELFVVLFSTVCSKETRYK